MILSCSSHRRVIRLAVGALAGGLAIVNSPNLESQSVTVRDTSIYLGKSRWSWRLFLQGTPKQLAAIRCVTYRLPPSFRDRERRTCSRGSGRAFEVTGETFGAFGVEVRIEPQHGRSWNVQHTVGVALPQVAQQSITISMRNTSTAIKPGFWDWTVFLQGSEDDLRRVRCVEYRLHPTFYPAVRTICERGTRGRDFALSATGWGEFDIGARVILADGSAKELKHRLRLR
jgi:transcription initiation factor IIF auxiliary subunit